MIIAKAPLRISFVWGWSDLPSFYRKYWGAVISTTIDKYIYITLNKKFDDSIRISYSKTEIVDAIDDIQHDLVRETLRDIWIENGIEITSIADIPSKGSWLWSSSCFSVALYHALYAYKRQFVTAETLAQKACNLEINICKQPIGKQDQYASAYGWLNIIEFKPDDTVHVNPIICTKETMQKLSNNLLMFYTGITRSASNILADQNQNMISDNEKQEIMKKMVALTYDLKKELENNDLNNFWNILHQNRILKKQMSGWVSNPQIDEWYNKAMEAWAQWGKILGAWGWWFLLFYVPQEYHKSVCNALSDLRKIDFEFETEWSKIIFIH